MSQNQEISKIATQILKEPISMRKLCDRVYQLMLEDLRNQRDRAGNARR
jgi:hypothetical protein